MQVPEAELLVLPIGHDVHEDDPGSEYLVFFVNESKLIASSLKLRVLWARKTGGR